MTSNALHRPRCSAFIAMSLDGFIAGSDDGLDWLELVKAEGEDYGFQAFFDSVDTLVLGRRTYETVLGFDEWPYAGKRCIVLTHQLLVPRHTEHFRAGSPAEVVLALGREGARHLYVDGGEVVSQFLAAGLIDELTVSIVPVLLGAGRPLFSGAGREQRLVLASSRSWPTGLVQLVYHPTRL